MLTCFIDESGCPGPLPSITSSVQPLLVIAGVAMETGEIGEATRQFARLTQRYHHGESRPKELCTDLQSELVKGAAVGRAIRVDPAAAEHKEMPLLDALLGLLRSRHATLFGTVIVKTPGEEFDGRAAYGHGLSTVAYRFHQLLEARQTHGTVVVDFREPTLNGRVSAELLEAKLGPAGDQLPWLVHLPTFGNSEVHAPLQMTDLVCSALLRPIAGWRFRTKLAGSPHLHHRADGLVRQKFRRRLVDLLPADTGAGQAHSEAKRFPGFDSLDIRTVLG